MRISTKGRYALSVMIDLAQHGEDGYISLKDISERQNLSMKYLETIVAMLNKAGMLDSFRGKNGGYKLNKPLQEYTVGTILKLTEGSLAPVSCVEEGHACCDKEQECITYPMWKKLDEMIDAYLESVTLEDLLRQEGSSHTCKSCDSCGK